MFCLWAFFVGCVCGASIPSDWQTAAAEGRLLVSPQLPSSNLVATIGNGYLATSVGSDTTYISGVFNGESNIAPSHRARLPGLAAVTFSGANVSDIGYALDLDRGLFLRRAQVGSNSVVEQTSYAHRVRSGLLVVQLCLLAGDVVNLNLAVNRGGLSSDLVNETTVNASSTAAIWTAQTAVAESTLCSRTSIAATYSIVPPVATLGPNRCILYLFSFQTSLDKGDKFALSSGLEYRSALSAAGGLLGEHVTAWKALGPCDRIKPEGNDLLLKQATFSSLYYLLSSVRADWPYSLSPGGLASNGYNGHTFWDCETWMAPTLLLFFPDIAASLLAYRTDRVAGYTNKARSYTPPYEGLCVSWESAQTGVECCPLACHCAPCVREIHINGDVALFAKQYFSMTKNATWLQSVWPFFDQMSQYWVSRSTANGDGSFSINDVLPPDEYADHANDSFYTNIGASLTLNETLRWARLLNLPNASRFASYASVASQLRLPFDKEDQVHLEFAQYAGQTIKQADVILASGFPFDYVSDLQLRLNDLEYYTKRTDSGGPAMTWSLTAINYLGLNASFEGVGQKFLNQSYQQYIRQPFFIWYETPRGGTSNFITGAGGFLQALPFGFGGLRITGDGELTLLNHAVIPSSDAEDSFSLNGVSFCSVLLDFVFSKTVVAISSSDSSAVSARHGSTPVSLPASFPRDSVMIQLNC